VHVPMYGKREAREQALQDLTEGFQRFKGKGLVVFGGDFNARCAMNGDLVVRQSGLQLFRFLTTNGLSAVNDMDVCSGKFTRVQRLVVGGVPRTDKTTIDYVLVPTSDEKHVVTMRIVDDASLDSDHRPLLAKFRWSRATSQGSRRGAKKAAHRKWKLGKMRPWDWSAYENRCERLLVPWLAVSEAATKQCVAGARPAQQTADALALTFVDGVQKAAEQAIGSKLVSQRTKPWVDKSLSSLFKIRSLTATTCKLARQGGVTEAVGPMGDVHRRVKRLVREKVRSNRVSRDMEDLRDIEATPHGSKLFWTKWKARLRRLGGSSSPDCVVDPDGNLVTDELEVLRTWRRFVIKLGKEPPVGSDPGDRISDSEFDDVFAGQVLASLDKCCADNGKVPELDESLSWEEVHAAVRALKNGKSPGPDGVPPELFLHGGIALELALTDLFNFLWHNTLWPDEWRMAILVPLFKGAGSRLEPSNHRMLAMMSVIAKLFETVLNTRLRKWSERVGVLSDLQGGFREGRGTLDQMFILNEIVAMRWREHRRPVFLTFIDVRKAYDRVWRPGLWYKLREAGVSSRMLNMIREMYRKVARVVWINGRKSEAFEVEAGVPQGAVLSPFLYAVYINGLHDALRAKGLGVMVYGRLVPLLLCRRCGPAKQECC
jgi:hypothetical protein